MANQSETKTALLELIQQFKKVEALAWEGDTIDVDFTLKLEDVRNSIGEAAQELEIDFENPIFTAHKRSPFY